MKRADNKSRCPVNLMLETFGDTWSLLILRDITIFGKKTFGEFQASPERIGPSVLAERLLHLEKKGIISKTPDTADRRKVIYTLTEKGYKTLPLVYEVAAWGMLNHSNVMAPEVCFKALELDRTEVLKAWRNALQAGSSFLTGAQSAVKQLGL